MDYLSSNQVKKYIPLNFSLLNLFCLFDLANFQKPQLAVNALRKSDLANLTENQGIWMHNARSKKDRNANYVGLFRGGSRI